VDATRLFNDRRFDGPPLRVIRDDTDETGKIVDTTAEEPAEFDEVAEPLGSYETQDSGTFDGGPADSITDPDEIDEIRARGRRL
jgi:type I restriction enzyme R subunit